MNTQHLRDFLAVVDYMNFSLAADSRFESASVLSKHIAALETELHIKLFDRTTRCVALTEHGKAFIQYAKQIIETEDSCRRYLTILSKDLDKSLSILATPVMLHYGIAEKLSCFMATQPDIDLQITECQPRDLDIHFNENIFDLIICGSLSMRSCSIKRVTIVEGNLVVVMKADHPLSNQQSLRLNQLRDECFLLNSEATILYDYCMNAFLEAGITPKLFYKGDDPETILRFVNQGMGVGIMAKHVAKYYNMEGIRCVDINPIMYVSSDLGWHANRPPKKSARLLINALCPNQEIR